VFVSGDLRQSIVNGLARNLQLKFERGMTLEQQFEQVICALQRAKKKANLLVVDNANDKQDLINFKCLLQASGWKVICCRCWRRLVFILC